MTESTAEVAEYVIVCPTGSIIAAGWTKQADAQAAADEMNAPAYGTYHVRAERRTIRRETYEDGVNAALKAIEELLSKPFLPNPHYSMKPTEVKHTRDDMRVGAEAALAIVRGLK